MMPVFEELTWKWIKDFVKNAVTVQHTLGQLTCLVKSKGYKISWFYNHIICTKLNAWKLFAWIKRVAHRSRGLTLPLLTGYLPSWIFHLKKTVIIYCVYLKGGKTWERGRGGGCSYLSIWIPEHVQNSDFLASQVPHIEITLRFKVKDYQLKMLFSATISKYVFHD